MVETVMIIQYGDDIYISCGTEYYCVSVKCAPWRNKRQNYTLWSRLLAKGMERTEHDNRLETNIRLLDLQHTYYFSTEA